MTPDPPLLPSCLVSFDFSDDVARVHFVSHLNMPLGRASSVIVGERAGIRILILFHAFQRLLGVTNRLGRPHKSPICGSAISSRLAAYGSGTSAAQTLFNGASSQSNAFSIIMAAISDPIPATGQPSSMDTIRLVFFTDPTIVSVSRGRSVRRSSISASFPVWTTLQQPSMRAYHNRERSNCHIAALTNHLPYLLVQST